jgi:hypothetical protein
MLVGTSTLSSYGKPSVKRGRASPECAPFYGRLRLIAAQDGASAWPQAMEEEPGASVVVLAPRFGLCEVGKAVGEVGIVEIGGGEVTPNHSGGSMVERVFLQLAQHSHGHDQLRRNGSGRSGVGYDDAGQLSSGTAQQPVHGRQQLRHTKPGTEEVYRIAVSRKGVNGSAAEQDSGSAPV